MRIRVSITVDIDFIYFINPFIDLVVDQIKEIQSILSALQFDLLSYEASQLLNGKYDKGGCMISIQAGLGGLDAQDWTQSIIRMYSRYCEKKGFKVSIVDDSPAEIGSKGCIMRVEGEYAYGLLAGEKGVHRLIRVSPYNSQDKRQTSFAGVAVWPIMDESEITVDIPDKVRV